MSYSIEFTNDAKRALKRLDKPVRLRVIEAIQALADTPRPPGVKALTNSSFLRIRVGDWRIVYEVHDGRLVILVITIGHRGSVYRRI